ncbi:hypothetical protein [Kitasatospora griseola]|uniref:hypothetical protein n=1 Tax=Kitasatospora griseola TaxID=2064 RepID=UPI003416EE9D
MSDQPQSQPQSARPTPVQAPLTTQQLVASVEAHVAKVNLAVSDFQASQGGGQG